MTIVAGFVGSYTLGAGQFCTKPGLSSSRPGTALRWEPLARPDGRGRVGRRC